jgi:hypothetical protein
MMPKPKKYKAVKSAAKAQAKTMRQTAKTVKKGGKTYARGAKQMSKAVKQGAKETSKAVKKGSSRRGPSQKTRYKAADAAVKMQSGAAAMASPTPKAKIKKKAYRTVPAAGHGPGKYVKRTGKVVVRKKRR